MKGSALERTEETDLQISDASERDLERSVKKGMNAPFSRILARLLLSVLIVSSVIMFINGLMKYSELQRERVLLEEKREKVNDEIDELKYLINCPVDYDYIVRVAREKMGLHLPDEIVYYNDYNDSK